MKLKRLKRARKIVAYFQAAHGFKAPFNVLLDGTAIQASLANEVDLSVALPKVLSGAVNLLVPRAVVAELHVLGRNFAAAAKVARRLKIINDEAANSGSAADALVALVSGGNQRCRFVMTEDAELRERLAGLPGVPLLRFARGLIIIELPGGRGMQAEAPAAPSSGSGADASRGGGSEAPRPPPRAADAAPEPAAKKRKRIKEPNPLSCKKKKKEPPPPRGSGASEEASEGKRVRRKRRGGGSARSEGE